MRGSIRSMMAAVVVGGLFVLPQAASADGGIGDDPVENYLSGEDMSPSERRRAVDLLEKGGRVEDYRFIRRERRECAYWAQECAAVWGVRNRDFDGCMRYYRC